jgi:hypothetical protein
MKTLIHAKDENALKNGSFVAETIYRKSSTYSHYVNGDFVGYRQALPPYLQAAHQTWTLKDARKLMPAC